MPTNMEIANTILEQLGGRRFRAFTGAKNFIAADSGLHFSLPGGGGFCKDGINRVKVTLTPQDLYDVEFLRVRGKTFKTIKKAEGIYCDQLVELFEDTTGLYTH